MENQSNIEKPLGKREVFVTMGCAKYPYSKIKELFGNDETISLSGLADWQISDDEKVQLVQETDFFPPGIQRILAFKFAIKTLEELEEDRSVEESKLVEEAFILLKHIYSGEAEYEEFEQHKNKLINHIETTLKPKGVEQTFSRIAALETLIALSRKSSKRALIEVSSIQRDVLGDEQGTFQLQTMLRLSRTYSEA